MKLAFVFTGFSLNKVTSTIMGHFQCISKKLSYLDAWSEFKFMSFHVARLSKYSAKQLPSCPKITICCLYSLQISISITLTTDISYIFNKIEKKTYVFECFFYSTVVRLLLNICMTVVPFSLHLEYQNQKYLLSQFRVHYLESNKENKNKNTNFLNL